MIDSGCVVAGTHSGCGKTTVTLALMAALAKKGLKVAPFKVGPDFIDPGHHAVVTGRTSYNLDGWMVPKAENRSLFHRKCEGADMAVVEGVMGLFDGYDGKSEAGSTAQMAKWLNLPVVLVVNARSMARSAAALVMGFERFDPALRFAGVIFNEVGSARHLTYLKEALETHVAMPCLGGIFRDETLRMPERHLGLVTAEDGALRPEAIGRLAETALRSVDLDRLLAAASKPRIRPVLNDPSPPAASQNPVRIAIAKDRAFCFYYPDNLERLSENGAQLVFFSPIEDRCLPADVDGLVLGGGYPELSAAALSANTPLLQQIRQRSREGMPIYGECGGFMYLCRSLVQTDGTTHSMAGCFPFTVAMRPGLCAMGYRQVTLLKDTLLGAAGDVIRGHEFHYSELVAHPDLETFPRAFAVASRTAGPDGKTGFCVNRTLGSYLHLHWGGAPGAAGAFVRACAHYQMERNARK